MAEENRCIRCGKPCAPNETMCGECKAWFESQTQAIPGKARLKTAEPKKQESKDPKKTQKEQKTQKQTSVPPVHTPSGQPAEPKAGKKSVLIAVIAVAAVCLIAVAAVFLIKGKGTDEQQPVNVPQDSQTDIAEQEQEPEEQPWDDADISSISSESCTLYGTVEGSELKLDSIMSFYILDESGQKYFFREVEYVALDSVAESIRLSRYDGRAVEISGIPFCRDKVVYIQVETLDTAEDTTVEELEEGIHSYEYVVKDCTWNEAFRESIAKGGYLAHLNSEEEYNYVLGQIHEKGLDDIHFYLGARRDSEPGDYFWADEDNELYGKPLNSSAAWCSEKWLNGEPSYEDPGLGIDEAYLNMFYMSTLGRFVWGDGPDDIPSAVPAFSGKVGYIVEYEE